jgi:Undecaprenyl-phosphate glucose phosphotransferase
MKMRQSDGEVVKRLLKGADALALGLITMWVTTNAVMYSDAATPIIIGLFALTLAFTCLFLLRSFGQYEPRRLGVGVKSFAYSFAIVALTGFAFNAISSTIGLDTNSLWLKYWLVLTATHLAITRMAVLAWTKPSANSSDYRQRIAIVGGGKAAEDAITTLEKSPDLDIEIIGLFDDRNDSRSPDSIRKHQKIGKISALADFARGNQVDLIIVAIPMSAELRLLQILKRLWELPVDIRVSGQAAQLKLSPRAYTYLGDLPLLAVFDRPLGSWNQFMKDTLDRVVALVALVVLSPVMLAVAAAVRFESKGPAIFKQKRFGYNNELIEVFKFRSMYTDKTDATASKLVTKNDPRVTKVGRIIRKTSLDELPQLFNVLTGQLSLVGPRPHATQAKAAGTLYDEVVDGYFARHKVKPGITGWAQINGWRGETDTHEKLEQRLKHDLEYIDRWSLGFDIYILAKTPLALLRSENAY